MESLEIVFESHSRNRKTCCEKKASRWTKMICVLWFRLLRKSRIFIRHIHFINASFIGPTIWFFHSDFPISIWRSHFVLPPLLCCRNVLGLFLLLRRPSGAELVFFWWWMMITDATCVALLLNMFPDIKRMKKKNCSQKQIAIMLDMPFARNLLPAWKVNVCNAMFSRMRKVFTTNRIVETNKPHKKALPYICITQPKRHIPEISPYAFFSPIPKCIECLRQFKLFGQ